LKKDYFKKLLQIKSRKCKSTKW